MSKIIPYDEIKIVSVQEENSDVNFVFMYQDFMYRLKINGEYLMKRAIRLIGIGIL